MDKVDILSGCLGDDLSAQDHVYLPETIRTEIEDRLGTVDRQMVVKYLVICPQRQRVSDGQFSDTGRSVNYY
jgi:hypothetical protein